MEDIAPDLTVPQEVDASIKARRDDTVRAAGIDEGQSAVEAEQSRINTEKQFDDKSFGEVALDSAITTSATMNIGPAIVREFNDRSLFMDDPEWNPRSKPEQMKRLTEKLEASGLPQELWDSPLGAGSELASDIQIDYAKSELEGMQQVEAAGFGRGTVPMFMASMLDVDTLTGIGAFAKIGKMRKLAQISKMVKAGKLTEEAALEATKMAPFATTRLGNMAKAGAVGAGAGAVTQGINAELRPTVDAGDAFGATLLAAGLGTTIGLALPKSKSLDLLGSVSDTTGVAKEARAMSAAERAAGVVRPSKTLPKGVRNNNPGNIEFNPANEWQGQTGVAPDGRFAKFESPEDGIRAIHKLLTNYGARGVDTINEIVSTYAPRADNNNTAAYIRAVTKDMGIKADQAIDLTDMDTSYKVISAIIKHENGGEFYKPQTIQEGIMRSLGGDEYVPTYTRRVMKEGSIGATQLESIDIAVSPNTAKWDDIASMHWEENPENAKEMFQVDQWGNTPVQKLGKAIHAGLKKTPFQSDYDRLLSLNSNVGNYLTNQLLESPLGMARNRRSANNLSHHMYETVAEEVSPSIAPLYTSWAKDKGYRFVSKEFHVDGESQFMREVMEEMEERMHAGQSLPNVHQSVKELADNMDRANKKMLDYSQGKDGEAAVRGMEEVQFKSGWFRRKWRGDKMAKIEEEIGSDRLVQAIATGMQKVSDLDVDMSVILSKAIVRRARDKDVGSGFGDFGSVSDDGKAFMTQALVDHAPEMTAEQATSIVDSVFGMNPERGKASFARGRLDIDLRTPIPGTTYKLMDLVEGDIIANQERYYRAASNYSALARKGIQKNDIPGIKSAILEQARAAGTLNEGTGKLIDDVFSYFGEGAYAGGSGPVAGRLNKLAVLSYLGNLGITQLAEVGATMGVSGLKGWAKHAGQTIPQMLKGKDPDAIKSLRSIGVYTGDHRLVVRAISMDEVDLDNASKLLRGLDRMTDKGMRAMGYMSGFYKVTEAMNTIAALTAQDFIARSVRDGTNGLRLKDMGVDDVFRNNIKKYIDDGIVEFGEDGLVKDMHYEQWSPRDAQDAALSIKLHVNTVVQKPQRGETANWMHGQVGSLLMSLKSFVITAGQKQTLRNMRHGDTQAMMSLLYGTGTAALAYAAKQGIQGDLDEMSFSDLAKGAIQWGNMTAPPLMILDPLSYLLGADKIPGNPFPLNEYRYGIQGRGLLAMPAGMSALNQLANLGRIPSDVIDDGDLSTESVNSLKALPVIGRSYPMIPILNSLSD